VTVLVVTGTGTGVGKTVATAAVAVLARRSGRSVAVLKPAQTGLAPGEPGDVAEIVRLAGLEASTGHELSRFAAALAPAAAARLAGARGPALEDVAAAVDGLGEVRDTVLVEGAGGLLVQFDASGWTLADLAVRLSAPVLVVVAAGLGTLNHTALTTQALAARGVQLRGVVVGSWPVGADGPDLAERSNIDELADVAGTPLLGALPAGMAALGPVAFEQAAVAGLSPELGGTFDAADFRRVHGLAAVRKGST
jgi:dethiobiotin synthetase